jgi:hypothetical protein
LDGESLAAFLRAKRLCVLPLALLLFLGCSKPINGEPSLTSEIVFKEGAAVSVQEPWVFDPIGLWRGPDQVHVVASVDGSALDIRVGTPNFTTFLSLTKNDFGVRTEGRVRYAVDFSNSEQVTSIEWLNISGVVLSQTRDWASDRIPLEYRLYGVDGTGEISCIHGGIVVVP